MYFCLFYTGHKYTYSLRPILPLINTDVSRHILVLDTSIFAKGNMEQREYLSFKFRTYVGVSTAYMQIFFSEFFELENTLWKDTLNFRYRTHHSKCASSYWPSYCVQWNIGSKNSFPPVPRNLQHGNELGARILTTIIRWTLSTESISTRPPYTASGGGSFVSYGGGGAGASCKHLFLALIKDIFFHLFICFLHFHCIIHYNEPKISRTVHLAIANSVAK
jgi:hypothetical protein